MREVWSSRLLMGVSSVANNAILAARMNVAPPRINTGLIGVDAIELRGDSTYAT
jgi:hypothetical protein